MNFKTEKFYGQLGRWLFPRRQDWQQRQGARILVLTVAYSLILGLAMGALIRLAYDHKR